MPDISKCKNESCKLKETCYRYVCNPNDYQSYGVFEIDEETGKCKFYYPVHIGVKENE